MSDPILPFRDKAAIQIAASLVTNLNASSVYEEGYEKEIAEMAYRIADALQKERGVNSETRYGKKK